MIKIIYRIFRKQIQNLFIEDLLLHIPEKVSKPAIEILAGKKDKVLRWLYFEANSIYRRNVIEFGSADRRNGMLMMIQALILLVNSTESKEEEHPVFGEVKKIDESWRKDVQDFKAGKIAQKQ